ncbi:MAG TPA: 4Fe-4S single cluster domain-containing protein [Chloroflexota bacterium]|nr:4Fe-4S single cluster domain-containing protein [Chloroflexota bacterium]
MNEITWTIDRTTGNLVVEGLTLDEASALGADLAGRVAELNCGKPLADTVLMPANQTLPLVRIAGVYHGSLVDGPGRRSVVRFQGCPIRCPGCYVPETHSLTGGMSVSIASVAGELTGERGVPRDGVTILGGEPFAQLEPLLALLHQLKRSGVHVVVYTGYTLEALQARSRPALTAALGLIDLLIDGPFVKDEADGSRQWRGSRNQRLIESPGRFFSPKPEACRG